METLPQALKVQLAWILSLKHHHVTRMREQEFHATVRWFFGPIVGQA